MLSCRFVSWVSIVLLIVAGLGATNAVASTIYDFENFTAGSYTIPGTPSAASDNWGGSNGSTFAVTAGTGADTTKVLACNFGFVYRTNDTKWSFGTLSDTKIATIQADFLYTGSSSQATFVALSMDGTDSDALPGSTTGVSGERGPAIGIYNGNLVLRKTYFTTGGASDNVVSKSISSISGLGTGDWISLQEVIDPTGTNMATLWYKNLTDGTAWTSLGSSAVNLNQTAAGKLSGFTSIIVSDAGTGVANYGSIDNISVSQIPEPSMLVLFATGLIGLLCYAWRKRR